MDGVVMVAMAMAMGARRETLKPSQKVNLNLMSSYIIIFMD